ncbi:MAG: glycosyltransferase [Alphaproteobacteria bacterium]|nr:MAG: glycosyltransferase [Alphaproteobacteria bacterium]
MENDLERTARALASSATDAAALREERAAFEHQIAQLESAQSVLMRLKDELSDRVAQLEAKLARMTDDSERATSLGSQLREERSQHARLADVRAAESQKAALYLKLAETQLKRERFIGRRAGAFAWRAASKSPVVAVPFDFLTFWMRTKFLHPRLALKQTRQAHAIRRSQLLDQNYYLGQNFDVRILGRDPVRHYVLFGAAEGRDPSPEFSSEGYFRANPDVALKKDNPLFHYIRYGRAEGRPLGGIRGVAAYQLAEPETGQSSQTSVKNNEVLARLRKASTDLYSMRPDDVIFEESATGNAFLERHGLLSDRPDFGSAQRALNIVARSQALVSEAGSRPVASVVVPVYGQLAYTLNCLDSLLQHASKHAFEVIVVDDRSPDESQRWLSEILGIRFVHQSENQGFLKTCNDAAATARGDYIVLLNNDTRVAAGWLDELIDSFSHFPNAGLVGSKLFYPDGSLQEAGGIIWQDGSAWNFGRNDDPNRPEYCYARRVDYVSGASIAVPKTLWDQLGGFDEIYRPAYCEDSDLAFRVREAGREVWMQPASRVIHYEGKSSGTDLTQGVKSYQVANSKKLFERWKHVLASHRPNGVEPQKEKDRISKRRVLVIDATTPTPDQDAGSVTAWMNLMILRDLGFKSDFVPQDNFLFQKRYTTDLQRQGIECRYAPFDWSLEDLLQREGGTFDFVMIFRSNVTHIALPLLRKYAPQAAVAFNNMDLHYLRLQRQAELAGDQKLLAEAERYKQIEFDVIRSVDCTVVPSYEEAAILSKELPNEPVIVLPYMTDIVGTAAPFESRNDFVFVGGYNHSPNVDAVAYFVDTIWPIIQAGAPGARFYVVGSNPPQRVLDLASDSVIVTGRVDDLQPYLDRSRVCVCPIRYGAGVKGKVTTAMAHGLPVVATTIAAEGMGVVAGRDLLVEDDPAAFAQAVLSVYRDAALWARLSEAGMSFAIEHNSMKMGMRVVTEIIDTAISVHSRRSGR